MEFERGKTGFVALLGRPNTGKSTFLNTLLGMHLAAVSNKPQTTRRHLMGIYNDGDSQILFQDCPGVHAAKLAIDEAMNLSIERALEDANVILCMVDPTREPGEEDAMTAEIVAKAGIPVVIAVNKTDVATEDQCQRILSFYRQHLPEAKVTRLVATAADSVDGLVALLKTLLPEDIFMYSREDVTDIYERDIASELIREAILESLQQEIPHSIAVTIDTWTATDKGVAVEATLNIEREAHKPIIIGKGGSMIRHLRQLSARKISDFIGGKATVALNIKVVANWRKRKSMLKDFNLLE